MQLRTGRACGQGPELTFSYPLRRSIALLEDSLSTLDAWLNNAKAAGFNSAAEQQLMRRKLRLEAFLTTPVESWIGDVRRFNCQPSALEHALIVGSTVVEEDKRWTTNLGSSGYSYHTGTSAQYWHDKQNQRQEQQQQQQQHHTADQQQQHQQQQQEEQQQQVQQEGQLQQQQRHRHEQQQPLRTLSGVQASRQVRSADTARLRANWTSDDIVVAREEIASELRVHREFCGVFGKPPQQQAVRGSTVKEPRGREPLVMSFRAPAEVDVEEEADTSDGENAEAEADLQRETLSGRPVPINESPQHKCAAEEVLYACGDVVAVVLDAQGAFEPVALVQLGEDVVRRGSGASAVFTKARFHATELVLREEDDGSNAYVKGDNWEVPGSRVLRRVRCSKEVLIATDERVWVLDADEWDSLMTLAVQGG